MNWHQQDHTSLPLQAYPNYLTADSARLKATRSHIRNLKQLRTAFSVLVRLQTTSQQKKVLRCRSLLEVHRNGTANRYASLYIVVCVVKSTQRGDLPVEGRYGRILEDLS